MRTASTNKKVREIITSVKERKLIPRPEFQRRLVWTIADKNHFLDSALRGCPCSEIYLADGEVGLQTGESTQLLVDGLQRVSTIVQYFDAGPQLVLTSVPHYKDLPEDEKRNSYNMMYQFEIWVAYQRMRSSRYFNELTQQSTL